MSDIGFELGVRYVCHSTPSRRYAVMDDDRLVVGAQPHVGFDAMNTHSHRGIERCHGVFVCALVKTAMGKDEHLTLYWRAFNAKRWRYPQPRRSWVCFKACRRAQIRADYDLTKCFA